MRPRERIIALVVCGCVLSGPLAAVAAGGVLAGTGLSALEDPRKAGAEAAGKARAVFGSGTPKLVLVFDNRAIKGRANKVKMLAGVASVFEERLIYGCQSYSPLTQAANSGMVGVLALGGDLKVAPAIADLKELPAEAGKEKRLDYVGCGRRLGEALRAAARAKAPGRVMILFGDCHVPSNDQLVQGVRKVLGDELRIVGGAAESGLCYYQGKFVGARKDIALLLTGDFSAGFCTLKAANDPDVVASAGRAVRAAVGAERDKVAFLFAFDCGGRRGQMGQDVPKELEAMKAALARDVPIFGFYGSGEIGPADPKAPCRGVGYHISACAIKTR